MAGFFSQALLIKSKSLCPVILLFLLLFLILISSSSSSLHDDQQPVFKTGSVQVFYIKNMPPIFWDRRQEPVGNKRKKKKTTTMTTTMTMTRRKNIKSLKTNRPNFSVMLPKGFVPPSGSSPCHNENPSSVVFFCDLGSSSKP